MNKNINAGKLIAEIERRIKEIANSPLDDGEMDAINGAIGVELMSFRQFIINTLREEKPQDKTCRTCAFYENNCPFTRGKFMPYPNIVCKDYTPFPPEGAEEVDLDKEIEEQFDRVCDGAEHVPVANLLRPTFTRIARQFYELGLNARKEE